MADDIAPAGIGCSGWNAEPNDGRNLKPTGGLNMADDGDKWSVSLDFKHTYGIISFNNANQNKMIFFLQTIHWFGYQFDWFSTDWSNLIDIQLIESIWTAVNHG